MRRESMQHDAKGRLKRCGEWRTLRQWPNTRTGLKNESSLPNFYLASTRAICPFVPLGARLGIGHLYHLNLVVIRSWSEYVLLCRIMGFVGLILHDQASFYVYAVLRNMGVILWWIKIAIARATVPLHQTQRFCTRAVWFMMYILP